MLKVFKYEETKRENIKFDIYIPINIEFGEWNILKEPTIYWRTGDLSGSLIEIGIGQYNKEVRSITLTICKNVYQIDYIPEKNLKILKGSPILELENINGQLYTDEKEILEVYIGIKSITIIFSKNEIKECLQNENVRFYIDDNKSFVGLSVNNISEENKATIKQALS